MPPFGDAVAISTGLGPASCSPSISHDFNSSQALPLREAPSVWLAGELRTGSCPRLGRSGACDFHTEEGPAGHTGHQGLT